MAKQIKYSEEAIGVVAFMLLLEGRALRKRPWKHTCIDKWVLGFIAISIVSAAVNWVAPIRVGHFLFNFLRPVAIFYLIVQARPSQREVRSFFAFLLPGSSK